MECPYCNSELVYWDSYGRIFPHQDGKILGEIYKCPIGRGDGEEGEECDSSCFNGNFYTDLRGELREGYPC